MKTRCVGDIGEITRRMCTIFYQPGNLVTCKLKQQLESYVEFEFNQSPSENDTQYSHLAPGNRSKRLLGPIFGALEQLKQLDLVQDYSVSQTTLSQVFINFAQQQG
ncbi:ATP-binding cassette sub- A member 1 [Dispira simplex]|nr:ATP-binding cassette sub- A member 1 [Dispira simplex]